MDTDDLTRLPGPRVRLARTVEVGGCNTCTRSSEKVWQIRGEGRTMEFRVCPSCMEQIQQVVGPVRKRKD